MDKQGRMPGLPELANGAAPPFRLSNGAIGKLRAISWRAFDRRRVRIEQHIEAGDVPAKHDPVLAKQPCMSFEASIRTSRRTDRNTRAYAFLLQPSSAGERLDQAVGTPRNPRGHTADEEGRLVAFFQFHRSACPSTCCRRRQAVELDHVLRSDPQQGDARPTEQGCCPCGIDQQDRKGIASLHSEILADTFSGSALLPDCLAVTDSAGTACTASRAL